MRIASGRIVDGKLEVEGGPISEGTLVTVLVREEDESFEVPPDQERELLIAIEEADRGDHVDGAALLNSLSG